MTLEERLNPAYHESPQEFAWLSGRTETEDLGEGYTVEIEYFVREDYKELEIVKTRALNCKEDISPHCTEVLDTAEEYLRNLYGDKIEFI